MARRKYNNTDILLPNGEVAHFRTHVNAKGELISVRLELPTDHWGVNGMWRAAHGTNYPGGQTKIVLDKTK
jgi:hypothetical protein